MVSGKKQNDGVKMTEIHDVVIENSTKLSNEFAKSQQQDVHTISDLQKEYLESIKVAGRQQIFLVQKEIFLGKNSRGLSH